MIICSLNVSFLCVQNIFVPVFAGGYLCAHLFCSKELCVPGYILAGHDILDDPTLMASLDSKSLRCLFPTHVIETQSWKHELPSLKLTWHLKITPWKRRFLLETINFMCCVSFRECRWNFQVFWIFSGGRITIYPTKIDASFSFKSSSITYVQKDGFYEKQL